MDTRLHTSDQLLMSGNWIFRLNLSLFKCVPVIARRPPRSFLTRLGGIKSIEELFDVPKNGEGKGEKPLICVRFLLHHCGSSATSGLVFFPPAKASGAAAAQILTFNTVPDA